MEKLKQLYTRIAQQGIQAISNHQEQVDPNLQNLKADSREGLTLLVKLPAHVTRNISFVLNDLKKLEPFQYYYTANTIHITVMDIRRAVPDHNSACPPGHVASSQIIPADQRHLLPAHRPVGIQIDPPDHRRQDNRDRGRKCSR